VFPARYDLNSYIVFRKRLVSKRLRYILILSYNFLLDTVSCLYKILYYHDADSLNCGHLDL
jgi:hypothetical protein